MPTLNYNDVVEISTDDAKQSILAKLDLVGFAATSWQEGSIALACVEIGALVINVGSTYAVFLKKLALNQTSSGDGLTRFSASHYDNTRQPAIAEQRSIRLACATGSGPYTFSVGDVVLSDSQGHTFRNVSGLAITYPYTLTAGSSVTMLFEAEVAGSASSVAPGAVNKLVTTFAGVTIASDTSYQVGQDSEVDGKLQSRNSSKWASLGFELIRDGAENIALKETGITRVGVDDQNPRGQATFDVYVAQPGATATPTQVSDVQTLFNARVFGDDTCVVYAAPTLSLTLVGTVYFDARFAQTEVIAAVSAALTTFIASVPLGGFDFSPGPAHLVSLSDIINAVKDATSSSQKCVRALTLSNPSGDIPMSAFQALIGGDFSGLTYVAASNG